MSGFRVDPAVWFPAIRAGTGADVFTQQLKDGLIARGLRAEISWLPHHAEYFPWGVPPPQPPKWANLVHVNTWLPKRFIPSRLPVVATMHHNVHDPALMPYKSFLQSTYHRVWVKSVERSVLSRANLVTAVSNYTSSQLRETFGIGSARAIYNGVAIPEVLGRRGSGSSNGSLKLLYVGSWFRRKGVDMLGPIMRDLGAGYELLCVGGGQEAGAITGLPPNCRCLGRLDQQQLDQAYREADVLLFPSRLEGFGLVVAEAMAYGIPVVTSRSSALREVVEHGKTGFLCAVDDVAGFCDAVRRLAIDVSMRVLMGEAARKRAKQLFSEHRFMNEYMECYNDLLSSGYE